MSKDRSNAPQESTALVRLDPQELINTALTNNASIETLERLFELSKNVRAMQAKEAWLHAMARFQEECPPIKRSKKASIQTQGGGSYSYTYAPLAEIMSKVQPVLGPLGLSISFRVRHTDGQVHAMCQVAHEMGHQESSGEVSMPFDRGDGKGANPAQRIGIASTYAKRYALLAILGIAPEDDADSRGATESRPAVEMPRRSSEAAAEAAPAESPEGGPTTKQVSRLWAIAFSGGKKLKLSEDAIKSKVNALLGLNGATTVSELSRDGYEAVCKKLEEWGQGGE